MKAAKWVFLICLVPGLCLTSCDKHKDLKGIDFRQEMRDFVQGISGYARNLDSTFLIVPQNGQELFTLNGESSGQKDMNYLSAIQATGREDLYYGYNGYEFATGEEDYLYMEGFLDLARQSGIPCFVIDYCLEANHVNWSYSRNNSKGFVSYAAPSLELNAIATFPSPIYNENADSVFQLSQVKNFTVVLDPSAFPTKSDCIAAIRNSNYDLLITDLYFGENAWTSAELDSMRQKANGGKRMLLGYMSIGEAEDYRYYWTPGWKKGEPAWLEDENPEWQGNYKVRYWDAAWQALIFGNDNSYTKRLMDAGFDGAYLDIVDGFEYFENLIAK